MNRKPQPRVPRIPFTQEGYNNLLKEKESLLAQRPEAVDHLKKGRDMGDLSENGYYKAARARLSFVDGRLRHLNKLITLAVIIEKTDSFLIQIGSTVTLLLKEQNQQVSYTIVGGYESDPGKSTISYLSPLGKALMGKKQGDVASITVPKGTMTYIIQSVA
jgi:transcription elongation factor GreA